VAGHEYARPHTGASITGKNSGNGALRIFTAVQMMLCFSFSIKLAK
jgi:hypothetical protein